MILKQKISQRTYLIISVILFLIYCIQGLIVIPQLSITGDEADHYSYASRFIKGHPEKVKPFDDASTMPVSALNTIPRIIEQAIHPELQKNDGGISDIFSGRYITLIVSMLTGFFTLKWSTEIAGRAAGLFSLFLFVYSPNLNAHSVLVTTDSYSALFTIISAYFFWKSVHDSNYKNIFFFALSLALAQLSKQSLTHLFFICALLFCFLTLKNFLRRNFKKMFLKIAFAILIVVVVINIGFQFQHTGISLKEYDFKSSFFNGLQRNASFIGSIPLPFPKPYIQGLDLTKNIDEMGGGKKESSGNIYLLGEQRQGKGFWYYYFVVLFFKTPIPVLVFLTLFLWHLKIRSAGFWKNEFIPLFIIVYLLIYFDFFYNSQVGIRHIIMIFPLLYVLLGKVVQLFKKKILLFLLMAHSAVSFYYYFPNLIAYTNEFVLPKRNAYRFIADSNIDYRQSNFWLDEYMRKHPEVKPVSEKPEAGRFILGINEYLDLDNEHKYDWIKNFKPVGQVSHSYLLFDVTQNELKDLKN